MDQELLVGSLAGVPGDTWALAFLQYYGAVEARPLQPAQIVHEYERHRPRLLAWREQCRLDLVSASLASLQNFLHRQGDYDQVVSDARSKGNIEQFFSDLPPDLKSAVRSWLKDRGFRLLKIPRKARK